MPYELLRPGEEQDYTFDWSNLLDDAGSPSDAISLSSWTISPQSGSPSQARVTATGIQTNRTVAFVADGLRGEIYALTNSITTVQGRTYKRTITLRCGP